MEYISSDTNVWIDFAVIERLELPFRLPYSYLMSKDSIDDELLSPPDLCEQLLSYGLISVDITFDEFSLAQEYGEKYKRLSIYDRIALAIAKNRSITLLTGDRALRNAAKSENIKVIGTLGILDLLYKQNLISAKEYECCLNELRENNGKTIRLPSEEIDSRIEDLSKLNNK